MNIQTKIRELNYYENKKALTIPKEILDLDEDKILDEFFLYLVKKEKHFTSSMDKIHPNLLRYLIDKIGCKIFKRYNKCYLEKDNKKLFISRQIWFGYNLVELMRNYNKKYFKNYFDEEGYINNLDVEVNSTSINGVKSYRRIDFRCDIGCDDNERYVVVEYLENHHLEESINLNHYQTIRMIDILFGEFRDKISHFCFVWDNKWSNSYYQREIINHLYYKFKDLHNIDNEERFIIDTINKDIKNKKVSKLLFDSYKSENNCILDLQQIEKIFGIKQKTEVKNKFLKIISVFNNNENINDLEFDFSDDEEEEEIQKTIYFDDKTNKLSNHGLISYLKETSLEDCNNIKCYKFIHMFPDKLGRSAYQSALKIRNLQLKLNKELIYGI